MAPDEKPKFNQYRKYLFWDLWKLKSTEEDTNSPREVLRQAYFRGREVPEAKKRQALADLDALLDQEEARKNHLPPGFSGWWQLAAAILMGS